MYQQYIIAALSEEIIENRQSASLGLNPPHMNHITEEHNNKEVPTACSFPLDMFHI